LFAVTCGFTLVPIFTIGHSNRIIAAFTALLKNAGVDLLADVRSYPASRYSPQFNKTSLAESLAAQEVAYRHMPALGGRRPVSQPPSPNGLWREGGFRNYADYAMTPAFRAGFDILLALGREHTVAIMCAESDWHNCHRRIVTDYLLAANVEVRHILDRGIEFAQLTPGARAAADGRVIYAPVQGELF
jgi:uncharacterized protein (DUF488 family)